MKKSNTELMATMQELADHTMHRSMSRMFQFGRKHNLSFSQMIILHMLFRAEKHRPDSRITVGDISERLDISNSAVSQLLRKLLNSEYVTYREDREDRRKKNLVISDKGREMVKRSHEERSAWVEDLLDLFSDDEIKSLTSPLELFLDKLKQLDPPSHEHQKREEEK